MTAGSSMLLNERACLLLSQGSVSEGLALFKKALSVLKNEIEDRSSDLLHSDATQNALYKEHNATAGTTGASYFWEHERFWVYSRPLSMQRETNGSACVMWNYHSDAFTLTFNVALASHLKGIEQEMGGHYDAASHFFMVAMKMYNLTLCQCQTNYEENGVISNTLNDHIYAAIFNNLAHVEAMLGEISHSTAFAEQLLTTLFYLVDSGRVRTVRETMTHKLLLENAHCLLMASSNCAAAA
jgi:hypothetical protein